MAIEKFLSDIIVDGTILINTATDDGINILQVNGSTKTTALTLSTAPTTSAGTYDILTRNTSTGVVEKVPIQYIYVAMSGQSNAVGYTLGTGGDFTVNNDVEVWNTSTSAWEVATSSNTHDPLQNGLNPTSNNIGWQFCKMMQKKTGKKIRYVLSALGGISITEWETTGANQYVKLKTAIVNSGIPKLDYFLWHQGEGDVAVASATYETKLKTFYANLKAETFFGKNTIIVNGQLKKTGGQGFQNVTYLRISQDPTNDIRLASSTDLVGWDLAHFTGAEVDVFAQRYFNTALGNERVVYENMANSYVPMNTIFGYDIKGLGRNGIDTNGSLLELGNSSVVGEGFLSFGRNGAKTNPVELQSYNGGVGYNPLIMQPLGGRALFGTRTDNTVDIIQANGTISASAATTSNQVVIKSQLDAKIGGTLTMNYIPKATGSSTLGNSLIYENSGSVIVSSAKNSIGGTVQLDGNWTGGTVFGADGGDKFMLGNSVFMGGGATLGGANSTLSAFAPVGITASYIKFGINAAEKMRLNYTGNFLLNTTTDNGIDALQVNGSISATSYTGSATLTGTPTSPTATTGTNTTQIATTAFVQANVGTSGTFTPSPVGGITFTRCYWTKIGNVLDIMYNFTITGNTTYSTTMTLPNSFTVNSNSNGRDIGGGKVTTNSGYVRLQETATSSDIALSITSENTGTASGFARASILIN